jgi:hypothetical protein
MNNNKDSKDSKEYRKNKKINKAKLRTGQKNKAFSRDEDSILNVLPSGAFDLKPNIINQEENKTKDLESPKNKSKINIIEETIDEEEYEQFDESYFDQIEYVKK